MNKCTFFFADQLSFTKNDCKIMLKNVIPQLFDIYEKAKILYDKEISFTPPPARSDRLKADYMHAKIIQIVQQEFVGFWQKAKYGRFTLTIGNCIILFNKLNEKGLPMNDPTSHVTQQLENQQQRTLFNDQPIDTMHYLFFGFKEDDLGQFVAPQLVYVDDNEVKWSIKEDEVFVTKPNVQLTTSPSPTKATVHLKESAYKAKMGNKK